MLFILYNIYKKYSIDIKKEDYLSSFSLNSASIIFPSEGKIIEAEYKEKEDK